MKIAIIGCGYVGTALAKYWQQLGHRVTATTRSLQKVENLKKIIPNICQLDITDQKALNLFIKNQEAVLMCVAADNTAAYESTYLEAAKALKTASNHAPSLKQIIYTSSTSVYGDHQGKVVDEETIVSPEHPTGKILVETENILLSIASESIKVCIMRLGEIHGPERQIADRLRRLNGALLPGTGESITNLIHLDDIVGSIDFALENHLDGIFNLCGDTHLPRKQFYAELCAKEGLPPVCWDPSRPSIHAGNKTVSNAKLKATGYKWIVA